jgi:hypothetical protein
MTPDQFCYWLQGLLELMPELNALDEKQLAMVRAHLGYVFEHGHLDSGARKRDLWDELSKKPPPQIPSPRWGDYSPWPHPGTADRPDVFPLRVIC